MNFREMDAETDFPLVFPLPRQNLLWLICQAKRLRQPQVVPGPSTATGTRRRTITGWSDRIWTENAPLDNHLIGNMCMNTVPDR